MVGEHARYGLQDIESIRLFSEVILWVAVKIFSLPVSISSSSSNVIISVDNNIVALDH